jgi:16S rRNA (guanine527-N7)-methyltransferase
LSLRKELLDRIDEMASTLSPAVAVPVRAAAGRLAEYLCLLLEENTRMNLVSERSASPAELVGQHLHDSLLGLGFLPEGPERSLLDIGTGGGFPAVPLLLVEPGLRGTLVESTGKKCQFLQGLIRDLSLTAEVVNARFPDSFRMRNPKPYDVLTTRAVAGAGHLVRFARPRLARSARALLWTTEPLFAEALRESGARAGSFHRAPGAERRGIGVLGSFT